MLISKTARTKAITVLPWTVTIVRTVPMDTSQIRATKTMSPVKRMCVSNMAIRVLRYDKKVMAGTNNHDIVRLNNSKLVLSTHLYSGQFSPASMANTRSGIIIKSSRRLNDHYGGCFKPPS
jgi:hypothetical protein